MQYRYLFMNPGVNWVMQAPDPESLMRSRYSAFVLDGRAYLLDTRHASARPAEIEPPEPGLTWLGLDVRRTESLGQDRGIVEFVARSKLGGRAHRLHEVAMVPLQLQAIPHQATKRQQVPSDLLGRDALQRTVR